MHFSGEIAALFHLKKQNQMKKGRFYAVLGFLLLQAYLSHFTYRAKSAKVRAYAAQGFG